jgi:predicted RNA-binding protein
MEEECTPITSLPALSATLSQTLILAGISYHTALSNTNRLRYRLKHHVPDSTLDNEKFIIVNEDDNAEVEISKGESRMYMSVALTKLAEHKKANPDDKPNLIVISEFESPAKVPILP